jgi:hypothetical protein
MFNIRRVEFEASTIHNYPRGTVHEPEYWVVVCYDNREIGQPLEAECAPADREAAYSVGWGRHGL